MKIKELDGSIMTVMKMMNDSDRVFVPLQHRNLAASYASRLKKKYGMIFHINQMRTVSTKYAFVVITKEKTPKKVENQSPFD